MAAASCCRRLWSLKEAFVKATGEGLGFPLGDAEFAISGSTGGQPAGCNPWFSRLWLHHEQATSDLPSSTRR